MGKRAITLLVALFLLCAFTVGCSTDKASSGDQNKNENKKVTVHLYTSESQDLVSDMLNKFEDENPDINVEIFRSGTEDVISKLEAEKSAGAVKADMLWAADIDYFNKLDEDGLLEQYDSPNAKDLDKKFVYDGGKYYEVRQIFNVLAYNTTKVKNPPKSWKDLYDPSLKGKAAVADPNYSGAAFLTLATIVNNNGLGWDYYSSLKNNDIKFEQGNGGLASKVASGEYSEVSIVDFMARNAKNQGSPVEVVWPEEGAVLIPTPVGIFKDSKVKAAAEKVLDYLLSDECQNTFKDQGYIPVNPNVGVPENAPKVDDIKIMPLDLNFLKENREDIKAKYGEIFK